MRRESLTTGPLRSKLHTSCGRKPGLCHKRDDTYSLMQAFSFRSKARALPGEWVSNESESTFAIPPVDISILGCLCDL